MSLFTNAISQTAKPIQTLCLLLISLEIREAQRIINQYYFPPYQILSHRGVEK
jgi:hypothetical protein